MILNNKLDSLNRYFKELNNNYQMTENDNGNKYSISAEDAYKFEYLELYQNDISLFYKLDEKKKKKNFKGGGG